MIRRAFLAFLFLTLSAACSFAQIALVSSVIGQFATGTSTTAINTTGATLLVMSTVQSASGGMTVSDNKGNTWIALTPHSQFSAVESQIFYAVNPTVGTGHTFTSNFANASSMSGGIIVTAWSGVATTSPFDQQNGAGYFASTAQPGSITPTANDELVITALSANSPSGPYAVDSGFTIAQSALLDMGVSNGLAQAYLVQTTATAENPTWSGGLDFGAANIASFKASGAGPPPSNSPTLTLTGVGGF